MKDFDYMTVKMSSLGQLVTTTFEC